MHKLERYKTIIAYSLITLTAIVGLLLFNVRVDEGGDDSTYICRALDFLSDGRYPGSYQGALYPLFLAPFVSIFGVNLFVLKFTSLLLIVEAQVLWYETLKRRVSLGLLFSVMALLSVNSWYLFYASQTYSEALFILIEFAFMWSVLRFDDIPTEKGKNKKEFTQKKIWLWALLPALFITLAYLTRTVGIGFLAITIAYFIIRSKWQRAVMIVCTTVVCIGLWTGIRTATWGEVKKSDQLTMLMQKDPYQKEDGMETFSGYCARVKDNSKLYISKHLMCILGYKEHSDRTTSSVITLLIYALFGYGAYYGYKKNRTILFMAVCSGMMLGATFVLLQALWDQHRLIIPYVAMALMVILFGLFHVVKLFFAKKSKVMMAVMIAITSILIIGQSVKRIDLLELRKNLVGDRLYGYTPDWYNYLDMCEWIGKEMPEESYVACRKPNMARIYADGRKFYGIYNLPTEDPDALLDALYERNVTHIIAASLRRDPLVPAAGIINTIQRYMYFISTKYPDAFTYVRSFGNDNNEPAYLFTVNRIERQ